MNFDFPFILLTATVVTGLISLIDKVYCYKKYKTNKLETPEDPILVEYSKSFFGVLLFVFILRSFLYEPFRVPTSSLAPTVLPGDFILTNKFDYGVKLPVWEDIIYKNHNPKRGDIVVFKTPVDNHTWLIKRLIGIPGDKISYHDKKLTINGQKLNYKYLGQEKYLDETGNTSLMNIYAENLLGVEHKIFTKTDTEFFISSDFTDLVVPEGKYFMMGDNRDNSDDSRFWGFVPQNNIDAKALFVLFSWAPDSWTNIRWNRIGEKFYLPPAK